MTKTINPMLTRCSALALSTGLMVMGAATAQAQSFNGTGTVVEGAATIATDSGTTTITLDTQSAVIDWTPDDDAIANFVEIAFQDAGTTATFTNGVGITDFAVLNRILPSDVTRAIRFDGNIVSQIQGGFVPATGGTVFFYTPGGIVIGPNATIDVGALGLTTAAPVTDGNGNFITANQVTFQQSLSDAAIQIEPGAQINALNEGSYVALFAPRIGQFGDIAVNGQAALVAGEAGTITFSPDGLFDIEVTIGTDQGTAIDHRGTITGPGSTGTGDNHRAYLVAVAKNNAITLAINGGTELGFEIAQAAAVDGDEVVLSAGHNIVGGEIDPTAVGGADAFLGFGAEDGGFGPGLLFTSPIEARARTQFGGFITDSVVFEEDARFSAGTIAFDFGSNGITNGSLLAQGNLSLITDAPSFGADVGVSFLNLFDNNTVQIDGDLLIASRAQVDVNGDGVFNSNFARAFVDNGSILTVGGDLIIDAGVDLSSEAAGPVAQAGFSQLFVQNGGVATINGVTRIVSDAFGAPGSEARSDTAEALIFGGGQITTGELNISADAFGGADVGFGGGRAESGRALISLFDANSSLTVLSANVTGNEALGELDFLSTEAFGADATSGDGGDATTGEIFINVANGATINLPDVIGSPLRLRNTAIGGSTSASDARAGTADLGRTAIFVSDQSADLGRLSLISNGFGGSAIGGAARTEGGGAFGGEITLNLFNTSTAVAFDDIRVDLIGGDGTAELQGPGGFVFSSAINVFLDNVLLTVDSDFAIEASAQGGSGGSGGQANAPSVNFSANGSDIFVTGDYSSTITAIGGASLLELTIDPFTGSQPFFSGGDAGVFGNDLTIANSSMSVDGSITLVNSVTGGDAVDFLAGAANSSSALINLQGNASLLATDLTLQTSATGGSIMPGGSGRGGQASAGDVRLSFQRQNFGQSEIATATLIGNVNVSTIATGGDGGDTEFVDPSGFNTFVNQDAGSANTGTAGLDTFNDGALTVSGSVALTGRATGGNTSFGSGGTANTGRVQLTGSDADVLIEGDTTLLSTARGGMGVSGGQADNGGVQLGNDGAFLDLRGLTSVTMQSFGGDAIDGPRGQNGGAAFGGFADITFSNAQVNIDLAPVVNSVIGGDGALNSDTFGGEANAGAVGLFIGSADVTFRNDLILSAVARGGDGFSGGTANTSFTSITLEPGSMVSISGEFGVDVTAIGGAALGESFDDAANGGANAFDGGIGGNAATQPILLAVDGTTLDAGASITLSSFAVGGSATDGDAGFASSGEIFAQIRDQAVITAETFDLLSSALGGSVLAGGVGKGGDATSLRAVYDINSFDPFTGEPRPNTDVIINADLNALSTATGGTAGTEGGDGGNATSGFSTLGASVPGTLTLNGDLSISSDAFGGLAPVGLGGSATSGGGEIFSGGFPDPNTGVVQRGTDVTINGGVTLEGIAIGGDGQTGGDAIAPFLRIFARNVTTIISGTATLTGEAFGGNALASETPGAGGNATGGRFDVVAESRPGDFPTLLRFGALNATSFHEGGAGGDGLAGADGGQGGEAVGGSSFIFGRAFDGTLTVDTPSAFTFEAVGGAGGNGVNGGDGGLGASGTIQFGTSSGDPFIPDQVNGAANYDTLTVTNLGTGGRGGDGTTGTGGRGGDGQGRFTAIVVRGAPLNVNTVTLSSTGVGGDGGSGAIQGDGGDGVAGFVSTLVSEAAGNPGRGSSNIGSLIMRSEGIGGAGATPGSSFYGTGGRLAVDDSDVIIGSIDIQLLGTDFPDFTFDDGMGGRIPVTVTPFEFTLLRGTLESGTINLVTPGEVAVTNEESLLSADTVDITAAAFVLPDRDPAAPAPILGTIDATEQLTLTALEGDLAVEGALSSDVEIVLDAFGNIITGDLSAPSIQFQTQTGTVSTGAVTSQGGAITIESLDDLDLGAAFASVDASSINARSINGDVFSNVDLVLPGNLMIEAGQSVLLANVEASMITARALGGAIDVSFLEAINGPITLDAATSIQVTSLIANGIFLTAGTGDVSALEGIDALGGVLFIEAGGSILVNGLSGSSAELVALDGDIEQDGAIELLGALEAVASGAVTLGNVDASSLTANALSGSLQTGALDTNGGAILLAGQTGVTIAQATGLSLTANAQGGAFEALGPITLTGAFDAAGAALSLGDVAAQSIIANSNSTITAGTLDAGMGSVNLTAALGADLGDVLGGSLFVQLPNGGLTVSGLITVANLVNLQVGGDVDAGDIAAQSIIAVSANGALALGALDATNGAVTLDAATGLALASATTETFDAVVRGGSFASSGPIAATETFDTVASGSVQLGQVTAPIINVTASGGGITSSLLNALDGTVSLDAAGPLSLDNILASAIIARTSLGDITAIDAIDLTGVFDVEAAGSILLGDVTAGSIIANALGGDLVAGVLTAEDGAILLSALGLIRLDGVVGNSLTATSEEDEIDVIGPIDLTGALDFAAAGTVTLGDVMASAIEIDSADGAITAGALTAFAGAISLQSASTINLGSVTGGSLFARVGQGDFIASGAVALTGGFDVDAVGSVLLDSVSAQSIDIGALAGGILAEELTAQPGAIDLAAVSTITLGTATAGAFEASAGGAVSLGAVTAGSITVASTTDSVQAGTLTATGGDVDLQAATAITLTSLVADALRARSVGGAFTANGLMDLSGLLDIGAAGDVTLGETVAGSILVNSSAGGIFSEQAITAQGDALFDAATDLFLGDITADAITTRSLGVSRIAGRWAGNRIEVVSPQLLFFENGSIDAGPAGAITLVSTNANGFILGDAGELGEAGEFGPYIVDEAILGLLDAGEVNLVAAAGEGGALMTVGTLDLGAAAGIGTLRLGAEGPGSRIRVIGEVTSGGEAGPDALSFSSQRFELDTDTARIDLSANAGALTIAANTIIVANGALLTGTTGEEAAATLLERFNTPATGAGGEPSAPALVSGTLTLEGGRAILIENSGTEETPAGFVVGSAEGLQVNGREGAAPLVVINGQIDANGAIVSGDEAATDFLDALGNTTDLNPQSQINGCELGGCIVADEGEITADVSAQVNGVIDSGSNSGSGAGNSGNTGGGDNSGGGDTGGDTGGDGGDGGDSGDDGAGDAGAAGAGSTDTGGGSGSGGDANPDNVDDGSGSDDFVIEDSGDGSDGSGGDGSGDDGAGGEESGDSDSGETEGGDETEGSDEDSEASDEEGEAEETEETEEAEEEESDEEEAEEEEEAAEEEEEDGEGPTTGPIASPPSLINENTLDRTTVIEDPISGTGNPALLDPDISLPDPPPAPTDTGGQQ